MNNVKIIPRCLQRDLPEVKMKANYTDEYLRLLSAISEVAIIAYTDARGRITFANDKFCQISGYTLKELSNQDHRILNSGFHDKKFFEKMYITINSGKIWRGEVRNKKKDGTFYWVDTQVIPVYGENNKLESYVSVRFDITERKQMEESLRNMEKLASLGEMAAVVAHEVNNPLAIIDLCLDSLGKELKKENIDHKKMDEKFKKIMNSTRRISKLVRGLKTFSRNSNEKEKFVMIELKSFIDEAISFLQLKCTGSGVDLRVKEIPNIKFECRPDQITQVLVNLVNNAHDAVVDLSEKWIELSVEVNSSSNYLIFYVRDSGSGIPDKIAEKILTPFFTTKEIGKGTGVGLSISKKIAEEHLGSLNLDRTAINTLFAFKIQLVHSESIEVA